MQLPIADSTGPTGHLDIAPSVIVCVGVNYREHAREMGKALPAEPLVFFKPPSAIIESGHAIVRPVGYERVDFEGELALIIGRTCRHATLDTAASYVLGYTCLLDITVRDLQKSDGQWSRAKGFDTFCPLGPRIVTDIDPRDVGLQTRVNGQLRQDSRTSDMIFDVPHIIAHISRFMTLRRGDIVSTGTPSGVGNLSSGDVVQVDIEGIGTLTNPVVVEEQST